MEVERLKREEAQKVAAPLLFFLLPVSASAVTQDLILWRLSSPFCGCIENTDPFPFFQVDSGWTHIIKVGLLLGTSWSRQVIRGNVIKF